MKKYLFVLITGILITACSNKISTEENIYNYENIQYIEDTTTAEFGIAEEQTNYQKAKDLPVSLDKNTISVACQKIKSIDFSIKLSPINLTEEDDDLYREAYLNILKSKIPTSDYDGQLAYFIDLYGLGVEFEELVESTRYSYYYNDLDGDGLPELGIKSIGYTYILKYEPEKNEFSVLYREPSMYTRILGTGQIWDHDGLHAGIIRDKYIVLNDNNVWETVFELEEYFGSEKFYCVKINGGERVDVGKENWNEITYNSPQKLDKKGGQR